ncbi:MAG: hypothetical protein AAFX87_27865 [Bacteroidota bacterium]
MSDPQSQTVDADEIDLGRLLLLAYNSFKKFKALAIALFFVGLIGGITYYLLTKPRYESKMVVSSEILKEQYCETLINTLNDIIEDGNYELLAERTNVSKEKAFQIKSFELEPIEANFKPDQSSERDIFSIVVTTTDNTILDDLSEGLKLYFENNEFVRVRTELDKQETQKLLSQIEDEIKEIRSVKDSLSRISNLKQGPNNVILTDLGSLYEQALNIYQQESELQKNLELVNSIDVIQRFTVFNKPAWPKLWIIPVGAIGGLFISILFIILLEIRAYLRKLSTEAKD